MIISHDDYEGNDNGGNDGNNKHGAAEDNEHLW